MNFKCPDCKKTIISTELNCNCGWKGNAYNTGVLNLLPTNLTNEKINENLIHEEKKENNPVWYDLLYKKKFYMERFERYWQKDILFDNTKNFLELGGGLCYISAYAKYMRPDIEVWATDVAPSYLNQKSIKVGNIMEVSVDKYAAIDAENLPFEDNQFDSVFIAHSIHHIGDLKALFSEVYRVLKPGGHFLGIDIAAPKSEKKYKKDVESRMGRGNAHGIHERSILLKEYQQELKAANIHNYTITNEKGYKLRGDWYQKFKNNWKGVVIKIMFQKV